MSMNLFFTISERRIKRANLQEWKLNSPSIQDRFANMEDRQTDEDVEQNRQQNATNEKKKKEDN